MGECCWEIIKWRVEVFAEGRESSKPSQAFSTVRSCNVVGRFVEAVRKSKSELRKLLRSVGV